MGTYNYAGPGLKKMFIAAIGAIVCTLFAIIPIINIVAAIGALVFAVISMIGLHEAGKEIEGCKTAFVITIASIVVGFIGGLVEKITILNMLFTIADAVCSLLVTYYVCTSVAAELRGIGANDVADSGEKVWKLNAGCYIVSIVVAILSVIPIINIIGGILGFIVAIVSLVAMVIYMIFLNKSYKAFGA